MPEPDLGTRFLAASLESKLFGAPATVSIGRFKVLDKLGQGGMGVVFAVYDEQLDRRVALKLLKGDSTPELSLRLRREAQAMAKLSHPNVVPVFEVGEQDGQLFIVLEYVQGQTLSKWVDAHERSLADVLDKYIQAGRGLAAAHDEGIIHRDFKPANAIVGESGRVQVLDFGLARKHAELTPSDLESTAPSGDEHLLDTPLTETGSVVGTPAYMAPEQFDGKAADHRTDQFAFCVSLWEAVSGGRPFAGTKRLELAANVTEGNLSAPAQPIPAWLRRTLERGLSLEPADRWESMNALLAVLERGTARRSAWLRAGLVVAGIAGAAAAVAWAGQLEEATDPCVDGPAILASSWDEGRRTSVRAAIEGVPVGFAASTAAKVDAQLSAYAEAWLEAHRDACEATLVRGTQSDAVKAQRMRCLHDRKRHLNALAGVLETADANSLRKAARSATQLPRIDRCADLDYVASEEPPSEDAAVMEERGRILDELARASALHRAGRYPEALEAGENGMRGARLLAFEPFIVRASTHVSRAKFSLGDFEGALSSAQEGFIVADGGSDREVARNLLAVGKALYKESRYADAVAYYEKALALFARAGVGDEHLAIVHMQIGEAIQGQGKLGEARERYEKALELCLGSVGEEHINTSVVYRQLSGVLETQGEYEAALEPGQRATEILMRVLGNDHPDLAAAQVSLGVKYSQLRKEPEAQAWYAKALEIQLRALGPEHAEVGTTYNNIALSLEHEAKYAPALERYQDAVRIWRRSLGDDHPHVALGLNNVGNIHRAMGEYEAALEHHQQALAIQRRSLGDRHLQVGGTYASVGGVLADLGRFDEALTYLEKGLAIEIAGLGEHHPYVAADHNAIADVLIALGRYDAALAQSRKALAVWDTAGPDKAQAGFAHLGMAFGHSGKGDCEAALVALQRASALFLAGLSEGHPDLARPAAGIVLCAHELERPDEVGPSLQLLRRLADDKAQPQSVAALLAAAEAVDRADLAAAKEAQGRLEKLALRPFAAMVERWLESR